jgi:hypothetical protein
MTIASGAREEQNGPRYARAVINAAGHDAHPMPPRTTLDQRVVKKR